MTDEMPEQRAAALLRADSALADDLAPSTRPSTATNAVLLTGATGFLGSYLLRELLQRTDLRVFCLVRAESDAAAHQRLSAALRELHPRLARLPERVEVLAGSVDEPRLGLPETKYTRLASGIDAIYHCAAEVNWARSYRRLRKSNVLGTLEVIRLACLGARKHIYFTSSIAVCFTADGSEEVHEGTDMLPHVGRMPLGYAQSKCVAESLLRSAGARGVPITVVRPALISGDTRSGRSNHDDLIVALFQGCVASGTAIDCDWLVDCVPVDHVARVLVTLGLAARPGFEVLHVTHERGRPWREVVLWMNLYGYPVKLVPKAKWIAAVFDRHTAPAGLFAYRRFFGREPYQLDDCPPYETYLEPAQQRIRSDTTRRILGGLGLVTPRLDAPLLQRYFDYYAAAGLLPKARRVALSPHPEVLRHSTLRRAISSQFAANDMTVVDIVERPFYALNGIFNEVSSARAGSTIGLSSYHVTVRSRDGSQQTLPILLKTRPADTLMQDLLVEIATLCDPVLGDYCARFKSDLGLTGCHERELALYESTESRLRRYTPVCFGTLRDVHRGIWSTAIEYVADAESIDIVAGLDGWKPVEIETVIGNLAEIHSIWYRRETELAALPWLPPSVGTARMLEMTPLWQAFATYSDQFFTGWLGTAISALQQALIMNIADWWPRLCALPHTLIHNDFNPRNLVLRDSSTGSSICVFDWELAAAGVPQHDLAEFLCFALPRQFDRDQCAHYLELHRGGLQSATGIPVDRQQWLQGFVLSLQNLLIQRLPLYTLMHRFTPQQFLPRVMLNWLRIYELGTQLVIDSLPTACSDAHYQKHQRRSEQILRHDTENPTDINANYVRQVKCV